MIGLFERSDGMMTLEIPGLAEALQRGHNRKMGRWLPYAVMVVIILVVATGTFAVYHNDKITPVTADGWLYADARQVLFIVGLPSPGGQSAFTGFFYVYDIEKGRVVSTTEKYNGTVNNTHITLLDQSSPVYSAGDFSGQQLILNIGPHGDVAIFVSYIFTPHSFADFTAAYQHLGT